jgi:hypothetical protein
MQRTHTHTHTKTYTHTYTHTNTHTVCCNVSEKEYSAGDTLSSRHVSSCDVTSAVGGI